MFWNLLLCRCTSNKNPFTRIQNTSFINSANCQITHFSITLKKIWRLLQNYSLSCKLINFSLYQLVHFVFCRFNFQVNISPYSMCHMKKGKFNDRFATIFQKFISMVYYTESDIRNFGTSISYQVTFWKYSHLLLLAYLLNQLQIICKIRYPYSYSLSSFMFPLQCIFKLNRFNFYHFQLVSSYSVRYQIFKKQYFCLFFPF